MSSGYLHLTFEPEATWGQIGTLAHDLAALDYDAPGTGLFCLSGTADDKFGGSVVYEGKPQLYVYWRKPLWDAAAALPKTIESCGLRGYGWLYESSWGQPDHAPKLRDWFSFGGHPMEELIQQDQERAKLEGAYYALKESLMREAHSADADTSLLSIAHALRGAKADLDEFNAKDPATPALAAKEHS